MSLAYAKYLDQHRSAVIRGFQWLRDNLPEVVTGLDGDNILYDHDISKFESDEYVAYDAYFYGNEKTDRVVEEFNKAWLTHIHRNPHHWQHWILNNDEPSEGVVCLDMDYKYIIEMICDWWSFSWVKGDLNEMFEWYEGRKNYIKLSDKTRKTVEDILKKIKIRKEKMEADDGC